MYENAPMEELAQSRSAEGDDVLISFANFAVPQPGFDPATGKLVHSEYLAVDLVNDTGMNRLVELTFDFTPIGSLGLDKYFDLTETKQIGVVAEPGRITKVFFPVYYWEQQTDGAYRMPYSVRFDGLRMNSADAPLVRSAYRVKNPGELPFLLYLTLEPGWRDGPLYHRLGDTSYRKLADVLWWKHQ